MAQTGSNANSTNNDKAVYLIERVNLFDFGYEKAGGVKGDPDIYDTFLNRIANGDLVEENYKGLTDEEKNERRDQIKVLESEQKEIEKRNDKTEKEIKEKEDKIDSLREEVLQVREVRAANHDKLKRETFSPFKFSINLVLLIMLSAYLFFFYVSVAFKALYTDFEAIAESVAAGEGTGSIMPQAYELAQALQYNGLLFLVPFVFYAFGWAFHTLLDIKHQVKYVLIGLLIIVTFVVDFLLALNIHSNTETAKELMGLEVESWSSSPTFYTILFLGFLVYVIWSLLLDSMLREWDKKKVFANINKIIKHHQKEIKVLNKKLEDLQEIKNKIALFYEDISTVMVGNLKKYVDQFTSGWVSYLAPENMKPVKERCLANKQNFFEKHGVKPGIVKVISKKG